VVLKGQLSSKAGPLGGTGTGCLQLSHGETSGGGDASLLKGSPLCTPTTGGGHRFVGTAAQAHMTAPGEGMVAEQPQC